MTFSSYGQFVRDTRCYDGTGGGLTAVDGGTDSQLCSKHTAVADQIVCIEAFANLY